MTWLALPGAVLVVLAHVKGDPVYAGALVSVTWLAVAGLKLLGAWESS